MGKWGVTPSGLDKFHRIMEEVAEFAARPFADRRFRDDAHDEVLDRVSEGFRSQGSAFGMKWPALSPSYAAWKNRRYPGRPLLVLTGRGKRSLTSKHDSEHVFSHSADRMVVGSAVPYMRYHQGGAGHNPERAVLQVRTGDPLATGIGQLVAAAIRRRFK